MIFDDKVYNLPAHISIYWHNRDMIHYDLYNVEFLFHMYDNNLDN